MQVVSMNQRPDTPHGYRFPSEIISHAVWLYHVFSLSLRDVELLLAEQGILVSYRPSGAGACGSARACRAATSTTAP